MTVPAPSRSPIRSPVTDERHVIEKTQQQTGWSAEGRTGLENIQSRMGDLHRFEERDCVNRAAFFPDGKRVLTVCYRGGPSGETALRIWDLATGNEVKTLLGETYDRFYALSPDGRRVLRGK